MTEWSWNKKFAVVQIKAARALLGWSQSQLAESSGKSVQTIKRLEAQGGMMGGRDTTAQDIRLALEASGIEFIEEAGALGVILRKPNRRRRPAR